jgi:hypothetical protein
LGRRVSERRRVVGQFVVVIISLMVGFSVFFSVSQLLSQVFSGMLNLMNSQVSSDNPFNNSVSAINTIGNWAIAVLGASTGFLAIILISLAKYALEAEW